jgi:hypothetical protein
MVHYQQYVAGWLESSIHDFLALVPPDPRSMKYTLITCLDSNREPASLIDSRHLKPLAAEAKVTGSGLLFSTKRLFDVHSQNPIFFGFDEVWFFPGEIHQPMPELDCAPLVGPARIDQPTLDKLGKWLSSNACSLALGDGCGLNFIVKARGLVKSLLGHSMEQPDPSTTPFETAGSA